MRLVNHPSVLIFTLAILVRFSAELAGQGKASAKSARIDRKDQVETNVKKDKHGNPIRSVPEPTTLLLLGAGAGVAAASKVWQRRRSRTKPSTSTIGSIKRCQ